MSRVEIHQSKVSDLSSLDMRTQEIEMFSYLPSDHAAELIENSISWTNKIEDKIISIIGFFDLWPGVCQIWALPDKSINKYIRSHLRCVNKMMEEHFYNSSRHRMQTFSLNDDLHNRWMGWLNFEFEGTMKRYGPEHKDYNIWAKVK